VVEFGTTLGRLRRNANFSTLALARAVNLDPAILERFEHGDARAPDRQLVLDLAVALGLSDGQTDELLWSANHLPQRSAQSSDARDGRAVALFVDHENVFIALNEMVRSLPPDSQAIERRKIEPGTIAQRLRSAAEQVGWVRVALAVADWERLPAGQVKEYLKLRYQVDYNLPGRNNADLKLSDAIRNVLERDEYRDIDTYILVTGDGGYLTVLDTLLRRQKQVHVWGVRGATNAILQQNASATTWIDDLLGLAQSRAPVGRPDPSDGRVGVSVAVFTPTLHADIPKTAGGPSLGNDVSRLEAMAILLAHHLKVRSWPFITFVRFLGFLAETNVFGATRDEQLAWLSHSKETGVLREDILDDPNDQTRIARRFSLNEAHPLVEKALAVRVRIGDIVPTGSRGLAFGVVVERLVSDPTLQLTDIQAKNWLTWFTENGFLQAEGVPHFRKEGVTVTLLRQNPTYYEATPIQDNDSDRDRLDLLAESCVVRLANFLERHPHFGWMALSQLLNQMTDTLGNTGDITALARQRAKQAVAIAQETEHILIEQIPNQKTGGTTTVARLNRDAPRVGELLALREALVRRLAEMLVSRPSVSRGLFQSSLAEKLGLAADEADAWIDLLVSERLFAAESDHDGAVISLRLDHRDLIVSRILFASLQVSTDLQPI
jgi:transcriptional regulator with XRE-family HTH domain